MVPQDLIRACIKQDAKAQTGLYRILYPMMMAVCTRYHRDRQEAASLMNQGFLKILDNLEHGPEGDHFQAWARRILINTVIDNYRKDTRRREAETDDHVEDHARIVSNEVNAYLHEMEAEAFAELLNALPPMSSRVFNLFAIDGYSHAEIASLLNISIGTSKWHVSNARKLLQAAMASDLVGRPQHISIR